MWFDVMKRFPPKVDPNFDRPVPKEPVRKILYPEDLIRAKYFEDFVDRDVINLKVDREDLKPKSQLFVEAYLRHRKPGLTVDEIIEAAENELDQNPKHRLVRKKIKSHAEPNPDVSEVDITDFEKRQKKDIKNIYKR